MQIKEGDEWKVAFTTLKESFEPIVMFFGLTNSPAIFQTMMNEILWDLINTGEVASFIDNTIVGMEKEEEHNEVIKKVVKRLVENRYMKPEKCKWKMREIEFLGVVIRHERIMIEKEKMKGVLYLQTPKEVKNV